MKENMNQINPIIFVYGELLYIEREYVCDRYSVKLLQQERHNLVLCWLVTTILLDMYAE